MFNYFSICLLIVVCFSKPANNNVTQDIHKLWKKNKTNYLRKCLLLRYRVDRCSSVFSQTDFFHLWTHIMPSKYHMWLYSIKTTTHRVKKIINIFSYSENISLKNQYDMTFEVIWVFLTWFILFSNCKSRVQAYKIPKKLQTCNFRVYWGVFNEFHTLYSWF